MSLPHGTSLFGVCLGLPPASGGYEWTVVPVERSDDYMSALEKASAKGNIKPFAQFLGQLVG